eukprot:5327314-Prymnesium_polylepis.1
MGWGRVNCLLVSSDPARSPTCQLRNCACGLVLDVSDELIVVSVGIDLFITRAIMLYAFASLALLTAPAQLVPRATISRQA